MSIEKNQLKIGIILNYVTLIIGNLIPVFYTPIMLRLLGQSEYGLYKLSSTFTSYLTLLSLGIGSAVTRYLIKAKIEGGKAEEERYLGLFVIIFRIIAIISFVAGIVLVLIVDLFYGKSLNGDQISKMKILVFIMSINTALTFLMTPQISVVTAHERFVFAQSMNILSTVAVPLINIVVLYIGAESIGMTLVTLFVNTIIRIAYYFYVLKKLRIKVKYKELPKDMLKEILTFSFWIFVANIVTQLYNSTDTIMIGMIPTLATTGVAVYNVGATFNGIVTSLAVGISSILLPATNKAVFSGASNKELTDMAIKVGRIQSYIVSLVVCGFVAFGKPFVYIYAGEEYSDAYWVAVFMMIPYMIPLVQNLCLNIVIAQNKHAFRSLVYLGIAILNVIGSWFALKKWGVTGAAAITGIALVIGQGIVMNWYYKNKIGLDIPRFWKEIISIYVVPSVLCLITIVISRYINFYNIIYLLLGIITFSILFIIFEWLYVINSYEKNIIRNPIMKILRKIRHE